MKNTLLIAIITLLALIISSCARNCGYPTHCWRGYFNESRCGTYVVSPCQKYCDQCTFNEPVCKVCLSCVNHDGCGYGSVKYYGTTNCTRK